MKLGLVLVALAASVLAGACGSDSNSDGPNCWVSGAFDLSCSCGKQRPTDATTFKGTCSSQGLGGDGACCKGKDSCTCRPVTCGISGTGDCTCGIIGLDGLTSCTASASTCCTGLGSRYCYCADGCQEDFESLRVNSCDQTTSTVTCDDDETWVASCE